MLIAETPHEQATTRHITALAYSILSLFSLLIYTKGLDLVLRQAPYFTVLTNEINAIHNRHHRSSHRLKSYRQWYRYYLDH